MKVFPPFLGAGVALIAIGIGFEVRANNRAKEGVAVYNNSIKQKSNANLDLGFSPNGVILKLSF
jgi:Na+/H+ antiporter NhaC